MGKRTNQRARDPQSAPAKSSARTVSFPLLVCLCLFVVGAVIITHWPVLSSQAVCFDDDDYLETNALVRDPSWASSKRFLLELTRPSTVPGYYQPLAMISLMLDYRFAGEPDNLRPFHRTSLILHAANTLLVIVLLYSLFGHPWGAAAVGLCFGVHPMTVETIAWIGERKTLLATFFVLGSLIAYVRYARRLGWSPYLACLALFVLALLSKPTSTPLPAVLFLLDFWPLRRLSRRTLVEKAPFVLVAGLSAVVTVVSQRHVELSAFRELSTGQALLLVCHNLTLYVSHMAWPARLSCFYPFPDSLSFFSFRLLANLAANAAVLLFCLMSLRWTRALVTGWLCCVILLSPTFLNMSYSPSVAWDKYAYLPVLGILLVLAWGLERIGSSTPEARRRQVQAGMVAVAVSVAGLLASGSRFYLSQWQTTESLCEYMLELAPDAAIVHNHRGVARGKRNDYARAIQDWSKAIELLPGYPEPHCNRGIAYGRKGDYDLALHDFSKAIELKPGFAEAFHNRGNVFVGLRDYVRAIQDFDRAIELKPDYADAYTGRAIAYGNLGDFSRAIRDYARFIEIKPDSAEGYHRRGNAHTALRDYDRAIRDYGRAIELRPDFAKAYSDRGDAYNGIRNYGLAIRDCTRAIQLNPDLAEAYNNRAVAHGNLGDFSQAILDCTKAVTLKPDYAEARNNLGNAYAALGDYRRAILEYTRAIERKPAYATAYINRGIAYYSTGEYGKAWADVEMCRQLGGEVNPELVKALAQTSSRPQ